MILCLNVQVGDQVVEINGEQTQGISHTRAIELIQAGGSKVLLLLRPQALLSENSELWHTNTQWCCYICLILSFCLSFFLLFSSLQVV